MQKLVGVVLLCLVVLASGHRTARVEDAQQFFVLLLSFGAVVVGVCGASGRLEEVASENPISIEVSRGRDSVERLADEWNALAGDEFTTTFSQPAWHLAWLDAFKIRKVAVITARKEGRLVGLLPMARARADIRGLYFPKLAPIARGNYEAPVVDPDLASRALPAMLDAAVRDFSRHGTFWWPNIPVTDPSLPLLRHWLKSRGMPFMEEAEVAPRLRLNGRSFEEVERGWTSGHRKDVRRQSKRLAADKGPISLWVPPSPEEAAKALTEFFEVHDNKWRSQGFPGMFTPKNQRHFRAIFRRLWGRTLHFSTLRSGGTNVSYVIGFLSGGWLQYYRPSYRPEFGVYSPSKVHVGLLVKEACERQWQGIDFLLGGYPYKYAWANETNEVRTLLAGFHKWAPSYLWFTKGKPWAKRRLTRAYNRAVISFQELYAGSEHETL